MTALGIFLHACRPGDRSGRTAPVTLPVWPVVFLALVLWGASCCFGASAPAKNKAEKVAAPAPTVPAGEDWLGRPRADVVDALGRPLSALQRGDTEILMYAKDVRFEIRNDEVVGYRSGSGPAIVASDGTQYNMTDRGRVARVARPAEETTEEEEAADAVVAAPAPHVASPAVARSPKPAPVKAAATSKPAAPVIEDAEEPGEVEADAEAKAETWMGHSSEMPDGSKHPMAMAAEDLAARGLMPMAEEPKETPAWVRPTREIVGALLRFGFALLIIRIAISVAELPCYLPDVAKVAALFVVVREGVHGLANFGGHWEWIRLFMIDDIASYFALMILLFRFKVALSGITAVKIATATISVNYFVMLMVGVVLSFMIG